MSEITQLLDAAATGDQRAAANILPLVYDELRKLAAARMTAEAPGHTLNATALVHEAYLRLVGISSSTAAVISSRPPRSHATNPGRPRSGETGEKRGEGRARANLDLDYLPAAASTSTAGSTSTKHSPGSRRSIRRPPNWRNCGSSAVSLSKKRRRPRCPRATAFRIWTYARAWLTSRLADSSGK